ncbi:GNAT family N-acetyltransferase [Lactobacillaceae bacterium Scapto_B20]
MPDIYVRRGTINDLPYIMKILNEAKALLKADGNPQWSGEYPDEATLRNDIEERTNYVLVVGDQVAGTATLLTTPEPSYREIDGAWHSDAPYSTIHRIAIGGDFHGMHLSSYFFSNLITITKFQEIDNVRFDTHRLNERMQAISKKFNFEYRGIIEVDDPGDPKRYAYELNL